MEFRVTWTIEVDAKTAMEAAQKALEIQRDPNSTATVFDVQFASGGQTVQVDITALNAELAERD